MCKDVNFMEQQLRKLIGERLLSERLRLQRTQDEFAVASGVSKRAYCNYESGERDCGSEMLATLAKHGVDVQFILTGIGSSELSKISAKDESDGADNLVDAQISPRALHLVKDYERCTEPMKDAIDRTVRAMANRSKKEMALGVMDIGESLFRMND